MTRSHAVQSVNDILGIVEAAQQQGRRLRVDHDRVVMAPKRLGSSAASWLPGGSGAAPARLADAKVARAVRETILRRIDDGLLGLGQAAGGPAQRAALHRAVEALHRECGPQDLPVARYRALLAGAGERSSGAALAGFPGALGTGSVAPRLSFSEDDPHAVPALLDQLGPAGHTIRGLLADHDHLLRHRVFPGEPADRSAATAPLMGNLSMLMDRLDKLASRDLSQRPGAAQAIQALQAGVETEVGLIAHALTLGVTLQGPVTWRTALAHAHQERMGMPAGLLSTGGGVGASHGAQAADHAARAAGGAEPAPFHAHLDADLGADLDAPGGRALGNPTGTPWGDLVEQVARGAWATGALDPSAAEPSPRRDADPAHVALVHQMDRAREQFQSFAQAEFQRLQAAVATTGDADAEALAQRQSRLADLLGDVLARHLAAPDLLQALSPQGHPDVPDIKALGYRASRALLDAQHALRAGLQACRTEWLGDPAVSRAPQVNVFADGPGGAMRYALVQPAPVVENLVLGGGGMKATGISAALQAYDDAGLLAGVKKIAGNSAGAITGGVIACGWPLEDLPRLNAQMSTFSTAFKRLDGGHQLSSLYPSLQLGYAAASHAGRLVRAMDFQTAGAVQSWLADNEDALRRAMRSRRVTMAEVQQLDRLRRQDFSGTDREARMVTFRDLDILHRIAPDRFKLLAVTAYDADKLVNQVFDVNSHPDLPIAYAARASMAAPVAFTSVSIGGARYLDGGFGSNVPVDVIHGDRSGPALDQSRASTMLLAYESLGETPRSLYGPAEMPASGGAFSDFMFRALGQADHTQAEQADRQRIWNTGPQTAVVYHGDLDSFDFSAEPQRVAFAVAHSRLMAQEQVAQRQQQAFHTVYAQPADVAAALDRAGRDALVQQLERLQPLTEGLDDPVIAARAELLTALREAQGTAV